MKLSHNNVKECKQCRLQAAVLPAGLQAVVLKKQALGKFKGKNQYVFEQRYGLALTPLPKKSFPFGRKELLPLE